MIISFAFFLVLENDAQGIYIYPENLRQGETIFIRVISDKPSITGKFNGENLIFHKKGNLPEWISFLGIDADQEPGNYKISFNFSPIEKIEKNISIGPSEASLSNPAQSPVLSQGGITREKAVDNITKTDGPALKEFLHNFTDKPYFNSPFSYPLSVMKKSGYPFGKFISFGKILMRHLGVDLKAEPDTKIYAINDGKVMAVLDLPNYGKTIIIDHGMDIFSLYLHLDEFKIYEGQMVKKGQNIGLSGDTGYVTAPHLHFSVRVGKSRVDPIAFIDATKRMDNNFILADIYEGFLKLLTK